MTILFFDLWALYDRFFPRRVLKPFGALFSRLPGWALVLLSLLVAGFFVFVHFNTPLFRAIFRVPFRLFYLYVWHIAALIATYGIATSLPKILRRWRGARRVETAPQAS